jgi:hypothetical protein
MYKRISNYLLENYPLFWLTRFWQMLFLGILLWVIAYLTGYSSVSLETLKESNVRSSYFRIFFSFHIILGCIIYLIWALLFFRNNPLDQLYPLKPWYFQKLIFQIFFPALIISSLYYPFTIGSIHKATSIINKSEMDESAKQLAIGYPFLIIDRGMYKLSDRIYPNPFPCNSLLKTGTEEEWPSYANTYYQPNKADSMIDRKEPFAPSSQQPILYIDPNYYIFYNAHVYKYWTDTCTELSITVIDSFITPLPQLILRNKHVLNFHTVYLYSHFSGNYDGGESAYYINHIAPKVYKWVTNHQKDSIANAINNFDVFCRKYKINFELDKNLYANTLDSLKYDAKQTLTKNGKNNFSSNENDVTEAVATMDEATEESETSDDPKEKYAPIGFVHFSAINTLYENSSYVFDWHFDSEVAMFVFLLAFIFSILMVIAFGTNLTALVISFVVSGIIISLIGLFITFFINSSSNLSLYTTFLVLSIVFLLQGYYLLYYSKWNKLVKTVSILISFYAIPIMVASAYAWLFEISESVTIRCGQATYEHSITVIPWIGIIIVFIFMIGYSAILKQLKSKAED